MLYRTHAPRHLTVQLAGNGSVTAPNQHRSIYSSYINSELSRSRNVVMNQLNEDIGYPQPNLLLNSRKQRSISHSPNYLQLNIKKMSEYGPDTVKLLEFGVEPPPKEYNPARILSIKKQQNSLKASTKMVLNKQLKVPLPKSRERKLKKLDAALQLNDRVLEIRETYSNGHRRASASASSQLHRFTQSYVMKRSTTKKKRAYEQVFGEELGLRSMVVRPRELRTADPNESRLGITESMSSKKAGRRDRRLSMRSRLNDTTLQFQKNIGKLDEIDKVFEGKVGSKELGAQIERGLQASNEAEWLVRTEQDQMLQNMRSFALRDREAKAEKSYFKIGSLYDLERIDPEFCREFRQHKQKKLIKMRCDLMLLDSMDVWQQHPPLQMEQEPPTNRDTPFDEQEMAASRPASFTALYEDPSYRRLSRQQKTMDFLRKFMRAKQSGEMFGIPSRLLYQGMYVKPQPYELEGSYLFFRAIEKQDMQTLRSMVNMQPRLLFQMDEEGRTPLILAAKLDLLEVCQLFIAVGCNLDSFSYRYHTAAHYAIQNRNPQLLFELLYRGASPWSQPPGNIKPVLDKADHPQLTALMQQARRISIVMRFLKYKQRPRAFLVDREKLRAVLM